MAYSTLGILPTLSSPMCSKEYSAFCQAPVLPFPWGIVKLSASQPDHGVQSMKRPFRTEINTLTATGCWGFSRQAKRAKSLRDFETFRSETPSRCSEYARRPIRTRTRLLLIWGQEFLDVLSILRAPHWAPRVATRERSAFDLRSPLPGCAVPRRLRLDAATTDATSIPILLDPGDLSQELLELLVGPVTNLQEMIRDLPHQNGYLPDQGEQVLPEPG